MTVKSARPVLIAAVAFVCLAGRGEAQLRLYVAGGPTYPLGSLADSFEEGWHAQASAGLGMPLLPVALRVDAAYIRFPSDDGSFQLVAGSINAVIKLPSVILVPYLIGGGGAYSSRTSIDGITSINDETTNFGVNIGAGARLGLPGLAIFAEARVHNVFAEGGDVRFAPLTLGINF